MINERKLRGKMVEKGYNLKTLSKAVGMNINTLRNKILGKTEFTISESIRIKDVLKLDTHDYLDIFYPELEFDAEKGI